MQTSQAAVHALCLSTDKLVHSKPCLLVVATNWLCVLMHAKQEPFLRARAFIKIPRPVYTNAYVQLPHAQSCGVLGGADKRYVNKGMTACTMHEQMCAFVEKSAECTQSMKVFEMSLKKAVSIFNDAAGDHWSKMFKLQVQTKLNNETSMNLFLLQVVCAVHEKDDKCQTSILSTEHTVAACVQIKIQKGRCVLPNAYIANDDLGGCNKTPTFYIEMDQGITVFCLRNMGLGTLLRACALLAAQQFAFFGSERQAVGFQGKPVSVGTQKIYKNLFDNILLQGNDGIDCTRLYALRANIPQSTQNVARMLWQWYDKNAHLCTAPLATRIIMHDQVKRKTALHRGDVVPAGGQHPDENVALEMHGQMCQSVENVKTKAHTRELFHVQYFEQALLSAVHIMNKRLEKNGCQSFRFSNTPDTDHAAGLSRYLLQILCVPNVHSDSHETGVIPGKDSVAAQLELIVPSAPPNEKPVLQVHMTQAVTVFCLRQMHLCTLLHACALLAAQQFAYFGSGTQTVLLQGTATNIYLETIYARVFAGIHLHGPAPGCVLAYAQLCTSSEKTPQSVQNVADMVLHAFDRSGSMYAAPIASQLQMQEPARTKPKP